MEKNPVPQKEPAQRKPPVTDPPVDPDNGNVEMDVDDAQLEAPRDDAFEKGLDEDNSTNRLKQRQRRSEELEKKS